MLWIQERVEKEEFVVKKVKGVQNPADMMTKNVNREKVDRYMPMVGQFLRSGRAEVGLKVQRPPTGKESRIDGWNEG